MNTSHPHPFLLPLSTAPALGGILECSLHVQMSNCLHRNVLLHHPLFKTTQIMPHTLQFSTLVPVRMSWGGFKTLMPGPYPRPHSEPQGGPWQGTPCVAMPHVATPRVATPWSRKQHFWHQSLLRPIGDRYSDLC